MVGYPLLNVEGFRFFDERQPVAVQFLAELFQKILLDGVAESALVSGEQFDQPVEQIAGDLRWCFVSSVGRVTLQSELF